MNQLPIRPAESTNLPARHRTGKIWNIVFFLSTTVGIFALILLLITIVNKAFGYVIIQNTKEPAALSARPLEELSKDELVKLLQDNTTKTRFRKLDRDKSMNERSQEEVLGLIFEQVVQPKVIETYTLFDSLFNKDRIVAEFEEKYPNAKLEFKAWLNLNFIRNSMSSTAELAGVRTALLGSLWIITITIAFAGPIGIGAAIYLEEYADPRNRINRIIQTNIDNLAGVPSIIYGILGLAIFVRSLSALTSGALFGQESESGRTVLSAGLTMGLLIMPVLIINAQEAIRAVPDSLRQASFGLGATRWQTIWHHVLPNAMPGILTGSILAISRAIGETAPLIIVGASSFINKDPTSVFSGFSALPIQIWKWTALPQDEFRNIAAAAIIVLLAVLLSLNSAAILLRNYFSRRQA